MLLIVAIISLILGYDIDDQAAAQMFGNYANKLCNSAIKYGTNKLGGVLGKLTKKIKWNEEE